MSIYKRIFYIPNHLLEYFNLFFYFIVIGTAVFVTVMNYSFIDSSYTFWNVSQHFITLVTLIVELFLNNLYIRADHYPFNMSWGLLYLNFIWPIVVMNVIPSFPYPFLATDSSSCFFYYFALFVVDFLFYYTFYSLSYLKYLFRTGFCESSAKISPHDSGVDNFEHAGAVATERSPLKKPARVVDEAGRSPRRESSHRYDYSEPGGEEDDTARSPLTSPLRESRSFF
jgi:hypothetical protein